jgi:hypothetical protein
MNLEPNRKLFPEHKLGLANELEPNRKLFPDHFSSILHGASVGAVSFTLALKTNLPN